MHIFCYYQIYQQSSLYTYPTQDYKYLAFFYHSVPYVHNHYLMVYKRKIKKQDRNENFNILLT